MKSLNDFLNEGKFTITAYFQILKSKLNHMVDDLDSYKNDTEPFPDYLPNVYINKDNGISIYYENQSKTRIPLARFDEANNTFIMEENQDFYAIMEIMSLIKKGIASPKGYELYKGKFLKYKTYVTRMDGFRLDDGYKVEISDAKGKVVGTIQVVYGTPVYLN